MKKVICAECQDVLTPHEQLSLIDGKIVGHDAPLCTTCKIDLDFEKDPNRSLDSNYQNWVEFGHYDVDRHGGTR